MPSPAKVAVIVAGGSGSRMGSTVPKQFLELNGKPVLYHTIHAFMQAYEDVRIVLVVPPAHRGSIGTVLAAFDRPPSVTLVDGGETRFHSVKNGLQTIQQDAVVFVHDGVRPLVSPALIRACYEQALAKGSAIPAIALKDSIREVDGEGNMAADRTRFRIIQTPQTFLSGILVPAFDQPYDPLFTDEATVVERFGHTVHLVEGEEQNIKITKPQDLVIAAAFLQNGLL
ncbi:2-C-methyl-D-erythritol 4-phosphate cytidylyltransferase [Chitinophaga cymbidii]|uniref:2-C-methyl-D-erythritol 4-phosphate cytidylyltransferase n=1 Tax=Chitinophaga cymbidii TaxID=1096750 RepID=A0A512RK61_9BACT|nr:2-C-methyl-D-erythritol 4-phosphate cytidylyltransferase [Chitinophaga cymbidii]GEP96101.1 2-C-methyl-D-erythritol 4-phosphate cytidylyltransferase [Chitinophaga cymbidii]